MEIIMSIQPNSAGHDEMSVEQWLAIRKEAGLQIDPETAEVYWEYGSPFDPYGDYLDLPAECQHVARVYFAKAPDSDIWVYFDDLPDTTREALWEKHKEKLTLPLQIPVELEFKEMRLAALALS